MEYLLKQIEKALMFKMYTVALQSTITLPDICGALQSNDGIAKDSKYAKWFNKYMKDKTCLTAHECYKFRCCLLHQGISYRNDKAIKRVIFVYPNSCLKIDNSNFITTNNEALCIDLVTFCSNMISAVRQWEKDMEGNANYLKNYQHLINYHPNGISPFIVGIPVIG